MIAVVAAQDESDGLQDEDKQMFLRRVDRIRVKWTHTSTFVIDSKLKQH